MKTASPFSQMVTIQGGRYRPGGQSPVLMPWVTTEDPLNGYACRIGSIWSLGNKSLQVWLTGQTLLDKKSGEQLLYLQNCISKLHALIILLALTW